MSSRRSRLFRFLLWTHRWMGIPSSIVLVAIALSGAVLVYEHDADRLLYGHLHDVRPAATRLSYDSLVRIATQARPRRVPAGVIVVPRTPDQTARVQFQYHQVFIDPYRGTITGERGIGESFIVKLRVLHHSLLVEGAGRVVAVVATVVSLLLTIGGIVLWWPRRILWVRRGATWRLANFDLHNVTGIVGALGILFFAGTAIALELGGVLDPLYRRTFGTAPNVQLGPASPRAATPLSIDAITAIGDRAVPGALREVHLPPDPHGTYKIVKQTPGEYGNRARNLAFVDGNDGRVRGVIDQNTRPLGSRMAMLMEDWHIGAFAPPWSRWLGVLSCLLLAVASATGPLIWWKPGRGR